MNLKLKQNGRVAKNVERLSRVEREMYLFCLSSIVHLV